MPDHQKMIRAFESLDLRISIAPYMSNSACLADYILPPSMQYKRADLPVSAYGLAFFPESWVAYFPALLKPPKDSDLIEERYFFWALAGRLGKTIRFGEVQLVCRPHPPPTNCWHCGLSILWHHWKRQENIHPARSSMTGLAPIKPDTNTPLS
ncbi:hypothetical protein [Pseudomonas aeruginosa]|uniref:hypothetical protein n=1 Tax=Pseudomonas aeruginosa TaxID=287 RepID=UPI000F5357F8|nr:hypothetical protein [Pseudomonas aeruginosa]